jgi:hypothetical protein
MAYPLTVPLILGNPPGAGRPPQICDGRQETGHYRAAICEAREESELRRSLDALRRCQRLPERIDQDIVVGAGVLLARWAAGYAPTSTLRQSEEIADPRFLHCTFISVFHDARRCGQPRPAPSDRPRGESDGVGHISSAQFYFGGIVALVWCKAPDEWILLG